VPLRRVRWKPPADFIVAVWGRVAQNQGETTAGVGECRQWFSGTLDQQARGESARSSKQRRVLKG
jgi:hypothetical protein